MDQYVIPGSSGKPISFNIDLSSTDEKSPVIIFLHGFKGFKDWGQWPLLGLEFASQGFSVVRMNFSHNGTTPETPFDFTDLEAFGRNTFSKESRDVKDVLDWLHEEMSNHSHLDLNRIYIVAHSRGGAIAMVTAIEDSRVKKVATLSSVSCLVRFSDEELAQWKIHGVVNILNGRTNQNMPLYYDLADDYLSNKDRFELSSVVTKLHQPFLVIHAEEDETVPLVEGQNLVGWAANASLMVLPNANHSFGGTHPYNKTELPNDTLKAVKLAASFFKEE